MIYIYFIIIFILFFFTLVNYNIKNYKKCGKSHECFLTNGYTGTRRDEVAKDSYSDVTKEEMISNTYTLDSYKNLMLKNNKEKLYKISLKDTKIRKDNCFETCDKKNCIKLDDKKRLLDKCLKCNSQKNKCFKKSIIGGLCNDCSDIDEKNKLKCNDILNFGCIDPNNLNNNNGVEPYFIQIPDINVGSPFDKKCVFCWNINSEL
jgi:hypothetical protein